MFKNADKHILTIVLLYIFLQIFYLIAEYQIAGHRLGVPLDDTWIHFRFAENFSKGDFFEYNIGEPTPGTTSPLWVIVLSIPFLFSQAAVLPFALITSSLFFLLVLTELYKLCLKLGFEALYSLFITLITMLCGRLLWSSLSGMEITLFCWLSILIFKNHLKELENKKSFIANGLLLGIAANVRPETYLLAGIYYLVSLILYKNNIKQNIKSFLLSFLIFIVLIIPYPVFSYVHTGGFLPSTYEGQVGSVKYLPDFKYLIETGKLFVKDNLLIVLLWFSAMGYFVYSLMTKRADKKFLLINLWVILLPAVSSIAAPNWRHHGRYLIPLIPFINIISIYILRKIHLHIQSKEHRNHNLLRKISIVLVLIFSINSAVVFANALGWNVENINNQQVKIGSWLNANLPEEKAFGTNDIGAITHITKKYTVDLAGLVTPEVFKFQKLSYAEGARALFKLLKSKDVNYIIIYPDWYEYIMENYSYALEQVYSARLERNTICGGIELFVYKIKWDKLSSN
ncbi:MAG: hypothetical protein L0Y77_08405 [Chlorobi bacterium]|nr:hypothetical protein [Chlorobiota bacterium]